MTTMGLGLFGALVAGFGALLHVYFSFIETIKWGPATVRKIAPPSVEDITDTGLVDAHIAWAKRLAFNVGVYNLLLAIGLAWTAVAYATDATIDSSLAAFFAIWLLGAAAAALYTQVVKAFVLQGSLGLLLLVAFIWA